MQYRLMHLQNSDKAIRGPRESLHIEFHRSFICVRSRCTSTQVEKIERGETANRVKSRCRSGQRALRLSKTRNTFRYQRLYRGKRIGPVVSKLSLLESGDRCCSPTCARSISLDNLSPAASTYLADLLSQYERIIREPLTQSCYGDVYLCEIGRHGL